MMATMVCYAQNTLVATLTHGENITMYYGVNALRDAYNAAVSGDVINLSGGSFNSVEIRKAVTLRGTGIDAKDPTYIINGFNINVPEEDSGRFSMEGIRCTGGVTLIGTFANPYFLKCEFTDFMFGASSGYAIVTNAMFVNCKFTVQCCSDNNYGLDKCTKQFVNCYINYIRTRESAAASFANCIIGNAYACNSLFVNSILYTVNRPSDIMQSSSVANNCVAVNYNNFFSGTQVGNDCSSAGFAEVFKTFTGTYSDAESFELTDAAKTQFLGIDGTEVGLYGGMMPYTSTPSYPQITKMNVASKTTADGKLSVEIEVNAVQ